VSDSAVSQVRVEAATLAHENVDRTIENADAILAQFDIVRRVRDCSPPLVLFCIRMPSTSSELGDVLGLIVVLTGFGRNSERQSLHCMLTELVLAHAHSEGIKGP
jgi:hypothetical protein